MIADKYLVVDESNYFLQDELKNGKYFHIVSKRKYVSLRQITHLNSILEYSYILEYSQIRRKLNS